MNGDLISREALLEFAHNHVGGTIDCNDIARFPAVDAVPMAHGRWIDSNGAIRCSECLHTPLYDYHGRLKLSKACPTCGANMWKEREE